MITKFYLSFILGFLIVVFSGEVLGQCTVCDHVVGATGNPVPAIPGSANGITVCITASRTAELNFNNAQNVTICISEGVTVNANFGSLSNLSSINNFGNFTARADYNGNWTINNFGALTVNFGSLNTNKTINNSGNFIRNGEFAINGSFNSSGNTIVNGNFSVNSNGSVNNSGNISVEGNYVNNGPTNSANGYINITGNLTNNGNGTFSIGEGSIGGNVTNNGNINIHGSLNIQGNLQINGGSNISAGDENQPNYLNVNGNFTGQGCLNGNNGTLYTNKFPTENNICIIGQTYIGGNNHCLEIIETPSTFENGTQKFNRIYIFRCSTDWTIPDAADGVILDEVAAVLVAGGGGGGRGNSAGGGGAGQLLETPLTLGLGKTIPIVVGLGGLGSTQLWQQGSIGGNTSVAGQTALGGGGGGSQDSQNGGNGWSGGGSNAPYSGSGLFNTNRGLGNANGYSGGRGLSNSSGNNKAGGGGGGLSSLGKDGGGSGSSTKGGDGGDGKNQIIIPEFTLISLFGGGGGGNSNNNAIPGSGGSEIGGNGNNAGPGFSGLMNTGSGGGAGTTRGGNGANGIVIISQTFSINPVEYTSLTATFSPQIRTSTVSWATAKEWENSHFEIERSIDNVNSFAKIGEVEGVGYSDDVEEYSFIDEKLPLLGGMAYYRLKQVDFSGSFSYSEVVGVRIPPMNITKGVWRAFPNPTSGESFNLELVNNREYNDEELSIRLVTSLANHKPVEGKDLKEISKKVADILSNSPNGVYILEVNWGQKLEYIKILKK
ncbi:hypothetical protein MM236_05760 [Belliella sp. DSM 107340]|uniref:Glycine-rich domain-containing protein n=1 Tax=Belliella calami TaxID=2923436 RepID=A0ABS9ULP4_9BACT|nr:hypothetical protein [Belliella calami]MCH7397482.1 hypothetical protein [Belliella calami]